MNFVDVEAEEQVVGAALAIRDGYERAAKFVQAGDFTDPRWARLFRAAALVWGEPAEDEPAPRDATTADAIAAWLGWDPQDTRERMAGSLAGVQDKEVRRVVKAALWQPERFARRVAKMAERRRLAMGYMEGLRQLEEGASIEVAEGAFAEHLAS